MAITGIYVEEVMGLWFSGGTGNLSRIGSGPAQI
jgi:hypothetical protein